MSRHWLKHLRSYREARGFTQGELAAIAPCGPNTISRIESEPSHRANPATADRIARALGVNISELEGAETDTKAGTLETHPRALNEEMAAGEQRLGQQREMHRDEDAEYKAVGTKLRSEQRGSDAEWAALKRAQEVETAASQAAETHQKAAQATTERTKQTGRSRGIFRFRKRLPFDVVPIAGALVSAIVVVVTSTMLFTHREHEPPVVATADQSTWNSSNGRGSSNDNSNNAAGTSAYTETWADSYTQETDQEFKLLETAAENTWVMWGRTYDGTHYSSPFEEVRKTTGRPPVVERNSTLARAWVGPAGLVLPDDVPVVAPASGVKIEVLESGTTTMMSVLPHTWLEDSGRAPGEYVPPIGPPAVHDLLDDMVWEFGDDGEGPLGALVGLAAGFDAWDSSLVRLLYFDTMDCFERWRTDPGLFGPPGRRRPPVWSLEEVLEWCREEELRMKISGYVIDRPMPREAREPSASAYPVTGCALGCTGSVAGCCYPFSPVPDPRVVELSKRLLGDFEGPVPGIGLSPLRGGLLPLI